MTISNYELTVGLEVHVQLATRRKVFAPESAASMAAPNTQVSPFTLAHPGTLPVVSALVIDQAIALGLACGAEISQYTAFDRKHYFYPDLPKGYQITQDRYPICRGGQILIRPTGSKAPRFIRLHHIHIEEDAGKSLHIEGEAHTLLDYNRAGMPLLEIVSQPDMHSAEEAVLYFQKIRQIVRYLGISEANMEAGELRCDVNVSLRPIGQQALGTRVEIKNLNSFRHVQRAIEYEAARQTELYRRGECVVQETRGYDVNTGTTYALRSKENLNDYRYFPEPDLPPIVITEAQIAALRAQLPTLPDEWYDKLQTDYGLSAYDALVLTDEAALIGYYTQLIAHTPHYKTAANWLTVIVKAYLNEHHQSIADFVLAPERLAALVNLVAEGKVSHTAAAQHIFPALLSNLQQSPEEIALAKQLLLQTFARDVLQDLIQQILSSYPDKVKQYQQGKKGLLGMFMGELMKATQGKLDPKIAQQKLTEALSKS